MYKKNIFLRFKFAIDRYDFIRMLDAEGYPIFCKNVRVEAGGEINEHCKGKIRNPF